MYCIWKYFWQISRYFAFLGGFRGISWKYLNFAGPRPREISEALTSSEKLGLFGSKKGLKSIFNQLIFFLIIGPRLHRLLTQSPFGLEG